MCFTAASKILRGRVFILLTVAIETDNPQSKDLNSNELNIVLSSRNYDMACKKYNFMNNILYVNFLKECSSPKHGTKHFEKCIVFSLQCNYKEQTLVPVLRQH